MYLLSIAVFQTKADGSVLFEQVCKQLNLLEVDYFGLEYQEGSTKVSILLLKINNLCNIFHNNIIYLIF